MTVTTNQSAGGAPTPPQRRDDAAAAVETMRVTIDGYEISVPKGTLVIRAAELLGIHVPRFCDHPLLDPVGACRQCLVEIATPDRSGELKPMPKPAASCTITVTDGMVVKTQTTSPVADKAQQGIMEMLLINHPLDCPVCDKGGECPLQNQAMSNGRPDARFREMKRTFPKPIKISSQVLLDRERCVLCARCTRFSSQIAGDPFIELLERGALQQVGIYEDEPFESYYSGNTVQICPVGALTGASYRFRSRPFDLVSSPTVCEHCASGCALRTDHRRGEVLRRLAGDDPAVNEEWNCDKGRWAFRYATAQDRLTSPLVRDDDGSLVAASWPEALAIAARGLSAAPGGAGVLVGGRVTLEDAYGYAKFARVALGTDDIDFRARTHSAEEAAFLASSVAGSGLGPTYDDVERAPVALLVALEPEDESPILLLRLRKGARRHGLAIFSIAPFATRGLSKTSGHVLATPPGDEPDVLRALASSSTMSAGSGLDEHGAAAAAALREPGAVILVGERLAGVPGGYSAVAELAAETGARVAWVPRRAGERGALEAGALPGLLPHGRPLCDAAARSELAAVWGVDVNDLPDTTGRDTTAIVDAARSGQLGALVVGGVEPDDLPDPVAMLAALETAFVVSLELRGSAVTERADVVLPVAAVVEKDGTFLDWEGRQRPFEAALRGTPAMTDARVLDRIADELDRPLGLPDHRAARRELARIGTWQGGRPAAPEAASSETRRQHEPEAGEAVLSTWRLLLDAGRLQDDEPFLAGTARVSRIRLSAATAAEIGAAPGADVTVSTDRGQVTLPLELDHLPDRVVWLPANSVGSSVQRDLGAGSGDLVRISATVTGERR